MIPQAIKKPLRLVEAVLRGWRAEGYVAKLHKETTGHGIGQFDPVRFRAHVAAFIESMREGPGQPRFRYSASCRQPTLYGSAYACMTLSLLGSLTEIASEERQRWVEYFDSFQNPEDGLFYDPAVRNAIYDNSDWWGARHLALHMIAAYTDLGARPRYPFRFLEQYHDPEFILDWLNGYDWTGIAIGEDDLDNKLMNVGCLLQYSRDEWGDAKAGEALKVIKRYLLAKINPRTGMWGGFDPADPHQRSRMVQFAYHLLPLFFYDGDFDFDHASIIDCALKTQNRFGGFGVPANSSACEDMDSLFLLIKLAPHADRRAAEIKQALIKGFDWVLLNQAPDGGFVFRLIEPFVYGANETSSLRNEGAMLPTWFRVLSIVYLARALAIDTPFVMTNCPGYEFA